MINPTTGEYRMLDNGPQARDALAAGMLLVQGTEDEVQAIAHRVKLGAREQGRRQARRKMQRASRRQNR